MTKRQTVLAHMRIAGYEGNTFAFTRLYCENRISREAADAAFRVGQKMKEKENEQVATISRHG